MKKLYEIVSKTKGATFELHGITFELERFTLDKMAMYESEGISVASLIQKLQENAATWVPRVAFDLMSDTSKEYVVLKFCAEARNNCKFAW